MVCNAVSGPRQVVRREATPGVSAMAEAHAYHEPPFVYVYHTTRWFGGYDGVDGLTGRSYSDSENLGVEVLTTEPAFRLAWPALQATRLAPAAVSAYSPPIALDAAKVASVSVTVACPSEGAAAGGVALRLLAVTSADGRVVGTLQPEPSELLFAYDSAPTPLGAFLGNATGLRCRGGDAGRVLRWSSVPRPLPGSFARLAVENVGALAVLNLTVTVVLANL
jgi:hypothetical protein